MNALLEDVSRLAVRIFPEIIAWHESGHAIIADSMGMELRALRMDRHTGKGGATAFGVWSPEAMLLFSLGGTRSERLIPGSLENIAEQIPSAVVDEERWTAALAEMSPDPGMQAWILEDGRRQVDQLLLEQRPRLDRLARQLLRQGHLDGRDVARILEC